MDADEGIRCKTEVAMSGRGDIHFSRRNLRDNWGMQSHTMQSLALWLKVNLPTLFRKEPERRMGQPAVRLRLCGTGEVPVSTRVLPVAYHMAKVFVARASPVRCKIS